MSGMGPGGILIAVVGIWYVIVNWRLWRDPGRLHPGHWRYGAIYSRLRRWPWQPKEPELSKEEIRNYARGGMLAGIVIFAVGLLLLVITLTE